MKNYFSILGLTNEDKSLLGLPKDQFYRFRAALNQRFREQAFALHPDKHSQKQGLATEVMQELQEAYSALSTPGGVKNHVTALLSGEEEVTVFPGARKMKMRRAFPFSNGLFSEESLTEKCRKNNWL